MNTTNISYSFNSEDDISKTLTDIENVIKQTDQKINISNKQINEIIIKNANEGIPSPLEEKDITELKDKVDLLAKKVNNGYKELKSFEALIKNAPTDHKRIEYKSKYLTLSNAIYKSTKQWEGIKKDLDRITDKLVNQEPDKRLHTSNKPWYIDWLTPSISDKTYLKSQIASINKLLLRQKKAFDRDTGKRKISDLKTIKLTIGSLFGSVFGFTSWQTMEQRGKAHLISYLQSNLADSAENKVTEKEIKNNIDSIYTLFEKPRVRNFFEKLIDAVNNRNLDENKKNEFKNYIVSMLTNNDFKNFYEMLSRNDPLIRAEILDLLIDCFTSSDWHEYALNLMRSPTLTEQNTERNIDSIHKLFESTHIRNFYTQLIDAVNNSKLDENEKNEFKKDILNMLTTDEFKNFNELLLENNFLSKDQFYENLIRLFIDTNKHNRSLNRISQLQNK